MLVIIESFCNSETTVSEALEKAKEVIRHASTPGKIARNMVYGFEVKDGFELLKMTLNHARISTLQRWGHQANEPFQYCD